MGKVSVPAAAAEGTARAASTKDAILDAAERVFGRSGFAGSSMREISAEAGVAQALLHYHFKSKDALYEGVFRRRSGVIVEYRRTRLGELFAAASVPVLEDILAVIATPLPAIFGPNGQDSRFYLQMVAEVTVATDPRSVGIVSAYYDPIGGEMVAALRRVLPELTEERAGWAYLFAIGARMQAHAHNHRAKRMMRHSGGQSPHGLLVPFLAAGIRAMARAASDTMAGAPATWGEDPAPAARETSRRKRAGGGGRQP